MSRCVIGAGKLSLLLSLLLAVSIVNAADGPMGTLGGLLKNLQGKVTAPESQAYGGDGDPLGQKTTKQKPYPPDGEVDAHAYENPLLDKDFTCETIVDPFELEKNFSKIISDAAKDKKTVLSMVLKPDRGKMLGTAKQSAKRMNWMPLSFESRYGDELHNQEVSTDEKFIARESRGRYRDMYAKADELLRSVLASVDELYPYDFKLFLLNSNEIQGHAAPGGYLYVTTAVLESGYADFVLAHEIAHVLKRHHTRELQARIVDTVNTVNDLEDLASIDKLSDTDVSELVKEISGTYLQFSRQQELQADACSVRIVGNASSADLRQRIAAYAGELDQDEETGKIDAVSVHPGYADRHKRMDMVANRVASRGRSAAHQAN